LKLALVMPRRSTSFSAAAAGVPGERQTTLESASDKTSLREKDMPTDIEFATKPRQASYSFETVR
jgi:hypothetical protein